MRNVIIKRGKGHWFSVTAASTILDDLAKHVLTFFAEDTRKERQANGKSVFITDKVEYNLFDRDAHSLIVPFGLIRHVRTRLRKLGITYNYVDDYGQDDARRFAYDAASVQQLLNTYGRQFRQGQREILERMRRDWLVGVNCPTGYGKSFLIELMVAGFKNARFDIVAKPTQVAINGIYTNLCKHFNPGAVGGGVRVTGKRVMVYTADSYHHALSAPPPDIVVLDEIQDFGTDRLADKLGSRLSQARVKVLGMSATWHSREDKRDFNYVQIAGNPVLTLDYQEGVAAGIVSPIEVIVRNVNCRDPLDGESADSNDVQRYCLWSNDYRNQLIATDALSYSADEQVFVSVARLEHALFLKKLLPDFELLYNKSSLVRELRRGNALDRFKRLGLWCDSYGSMSTERLSSLIRDAVAGKLKKFIATPVLSVGVDLSRLTALVRADAVSTKIVSTQLPGRVSRVGGLDGKVSGRVHDYADNFRASLHNKWKNRERIYESKGWTIRFIG